jgi:hypothetical protein
MPDITYVYFIQQGFGASAMIWIFASVVLVLMVLHPDFRKFMLGAAIIGATVLFCWLAILASQNRL